MDSNGIEHKVPYLPSHLQYSSDGNEIAYTYYDMVRSKLHVVKGESEYELPLDYVHNIKYLQDNLHLIIL